MDWISANKDLLTILVAFLAVLVSLVTVVISRRNSQVNSFVAIQSVMLDGDLQRGRILIYRAINTGEMPPSNSDEAYLVTRSLAIFDLLGAYTRRRVVPRKWVLEFWHARLQFLRHGYGVDVNFNNLYSIRGRPDLLDLIERAERYRCARVCCIQGERERRLLGPGVKNLENRRDDIKGSAGDAPLGT